MWQPLVGPVLPRQGLAAPPRAAQGAGVLLSTGHARPWLCNPSKKRQQVAAEVALQVLPEACSAHQLPVWPQGPL